MQENTERDGDTIRFVHDTKPGANIRPRAGDIATGDVLFKQGHSLTAQDLMLLSSIGISDVEVLRKPKVAIVATGDELTEPGKAIAPHQIFESHRAGITAKLHELGCDVTDAGLLKDDKEVISKTFESLSKNHDLVISSGGVSVGDADWVKPALSALGTLHLWKLAIKPGKPFAFGQFGSCYFCGLPGNPVSAFVTFDQIVMPLIQALRGGTAKQKLTLPAFLETPVKRRSGRKEFARGTFHTDENGELRVSLLKKQSSSVMTSLTNANCYVVLEADCEALAQGEKVFIQPFTTEC
jgi:molybdopterin molybdotransferase